MSEQSAGSTPPPAHKPGDVVDGYVLTSDFEWVSIAPAAAVETPVDSVGTESGEGAEQASDAAAPTFGQPPARPASARSRWTFALAWVGVSLIVLVATTFLPWSSASLNGKVVHTTHFWGMRTLNWIAIGALIAFVVFGLLAAWAAAKRQQAVAWIFLVFSLAGLVWVAVAFVVRIGQLNDLAVKLLKNSGSTVKASITFTTGLWVWVAITVVIAVVGVFVIRRMSRQVVEAAPSA